MKDYPKIRALANYLRQNQPSVYKEYCDVYDSEEGVSRFKALRKFLRKDHRLYMLAEKYAYKKLGPGSTGSLLNRNEWFVLRHPHIEPTCSVCGREKAPWSEKCALTCPSTREKKRATCIERYGSDNPSRVDEIKKKREATFMKKYGVANPFQDAGVVKKSRETLLKKLGVDNPTKSPVVRAKVRETFMRNYGFDHWTKSPDMLDKVYAFTEEMLEKARETCLRRYGVDNPFKDAGINKKAKKSVMDRYGVENVFMLKEMQERARKSVMKKFGVKNVFELKEVQERIRDLVMERYGVRSMLELERVREQGRYAQEAKYGGNPLKHPDIQAKVKATFMERYGVTNASQIPEVKDRIRETKLARYGTLFFGYARKRVRDHLGKWHSVQGYEDSVIRQLRQFKNIESIHSKIGEVPRFKYIGEDGEEHYYFPDLMVRLKNGAKSVIEVKSTWTLKLHLKTNLRKFRKAVEVCAKNNANFVLLVASPKEKRIIRVVNPTTLKALRDAGIPL